MFRVYVNITSSVNVSSYFIFLGEGEPFEPHHKCFPIQDGVVGRLQSQHLGGGGSTVRG